MNNIIAIAGASNSGKTTLAQWLTQRGYKVVSESDIASGQRIPSGKIVIDGINSEELAKKVRQQGGAVFFIRRQGAVEKTVTPRPGDSFIQNSSLSLLFDTTASLLRMAA